MQQGRMTQASAGDLLCKAAMVQMAQVHTSRLELLAGRERIAQCRDAALVVSAL
jgi:hypothetical protein